MRVALVSDIHANEIALEAVLDDAKRFGIDTIVCLGDTATLGPKPNEVLDRLIDLGCPCILGNHDEFILNRELVARYTDARPVVDSIEWCRARMSESDLRFIRSFVSTLELDLGGGVTLFAFHGSPRSHMENLLAETPAEALDTMLGTHRASVMAGGHTHVQMLRQHRGAWLLNPGSVGMPFREFVNGGPPTVLPHAEYAVVESYAGGVQVSLRRVDLDRALLLGSVRDSDLPLAGMLAANYT